MFDMQAAIRAFSRAWAKTGKRIAARMAIIAITTRSSISVKPYLRTLSLLSSRREPAYLRAQRDRANPARGEGGSAPAGDCGGIPWDGSAWHDRPECGYSPCAPAEVSEQGHSSGVKRRQVPSGWGGSSDS